MSAGTAQTVLDRRLRDPLADCRMRGDGIGFVGCDIPIDVLLAAGRPFGHLPWRTLGETPWADLWLEPSFPFWARSILEQWHQGEFDEIGSVVFSRADDASQRLYYYVAELQRRGKLRGPAARIFDIALVPRESSRLHTAGAVTELMRVLDVNATALESGIGLANGLRRIFAEIEAARSTDGPLHARIGRAALWSDATQWIDDLELPAAADGGPRILLAGSMPADERLHVAVELAGATVVAEAHALASSRLGPEIAAGEEPLASLVARQLRRASVAPRAFLDRAAWLVARAKGARAEGVILWLTREDEALAWSVPAAQQALAAADVPTLVLPAARWQADDGAVERIAAFCGRCAHAAA